MVRRLANYDASALNQLLSDPLIQMVMRADRVSEQELITSVSGVLHELSIGSAGAPNNAKRGRSEVDYRPRVGIILLNKHNQVFVGQRRHGRPGEIWQMPQDDIRMAEEPREAALRTLRMRLGAEGADVLAEDRNWLYYELPVGVTGRVRHKGGRGERQKWFVMRLRDRDSCIRIDEQLSEFCDWKWISISELPKHIVSFKKLVYLTAMEEFLDALSP